MSTTPKPLFVFARATTSLKAPGDKYPSQIHEGRTYWSDWPVVVAHPDAFSPTPTRILPANWVPAEAPVEQATAAPGEKRTVRRAD